VNEKRDLTWKSTRRTNAWRDIIVLEAGQRQGKNTMTSLLDKRIDPRPMAHHFSKFRAPSLCCASRDIYPW